MRDPAGAAGLGTLASMDTAGAEGDAVTSRLATCVAGPRWITVSVGAALTSVLLRSSGEVTLVTSDVKVFSIAALALPSADSISSHDRTPRGCPFLEAMLLCISRLKAAEEAVTFAHNSRAAGTAFVW